MKERPILFSGEMVRAILDGTKTQTRRIISPQPLLRKRKSLPPVWDWKPRKGVLYTSQNVNWEPFQNAFADHVECGHSSYGAKGDHLWVKETHFDARPFKHEPLFAAMELDYVYRADYDYREGQREPSVINSHHWRPSLFCTRAASRITLEIISIRGERLNDISESDAIAEGIKLRGITRFEDEAVGEYKQLWEKINGSGSWDLNPWVWCLTFKRIKP